MSVESTARPVSEMPKMSANGGAPAPSSSSEEPISSRLMMSYIFGSASVLLSAVAMSPIVKGLSPYWGGNLKFETQVRLGEQFQRFSDFFVYALVLGVVGMILAISHRGPSALRDGFNKIWMSVLLSSIGVLASLYVWYTIFTSSLR